MAKLEELLENEEFMEKMQAVETEDEAKSLFGKYDIELPKTNDTSLSEEELSKVAGGRYGITLNGVIDFLCGEGTADLTWKGLWVSAVCIYDYCKYGNGYRTYSKAYVKKMGNNLEKRIPNWMKKVSEWGTF